MTSAISKLNLLDDTEYVYERKLHYIYCNILHSIIADKELQSN